MPVKPIAQPPRPRHARELGDRQRVDVTDAALVQIAGPGMVHGVGAPPEVVGAERQHPDQSPRPIVRPLAAEKRAVPAVVLDQE
jgi:hypothetical protein